MTQRTVWTATGVALWLVLSLTLQAVGVSQLTAHLCAAAVAFIVMAGVRVALTTRPSTGGRGRPVRRIVVGWPTGPAITVGAATGLLAYGATLIDHTPIGWALFAVGALAGLGFMVRAGQFVNHLNVNSELDWTWSGFSVVVLLVLLLGTQVLRWHGEVLITAPVYAVAVTGLVAYGLRRWGGWVVGPEPG